MKRPTAAEINARNRKRAQYRARLGDRLWNTSSGPIETTPELERALNTPLNDLPVDHTLRRALREHLYLVAPRDAHLPQDVALIEGPHPPDRGHFHAAAFPIAA